MTDTHPPPPEGQARVEPVEDVNARGLFLTGLGLLALVVLVCLVVAWQFSTYKTEEDKAKESPYPLGEAERSRPLEERWPDDPRFKEAEQELKRSPYLREDQPLPEFFPKRPRLEGLDTPVNLDDPITSGTKSWPGLAPGERKADDKVLDRPRWADKKAETVYLPIEESMKRLAPTLPVRSSASDGRKVDRYYQTPSAANSGRSSEEGKP